MRIAQICPYDIDRPGGVQMHIRDTAAALEEAGHKLVIVAPNVNENTRTAPWGSASCPEIVRLGAARKIKLGATSFEISIALGQDKARLETLMRNGGFDVVHLHTMWTPILPYQAFLNSRAANVATFHDTAAKTGTGTVLRFLFRNLSRYLIPQLDAAIAVSEAPMEHLKAARGQKVHIVPPCTDLRRFATAVPALRQRDDGRVNILFLGRLEKRKGLDLLLQAYRRLAAEGLKVRLLIAGGGPDEGAARRIVSDDALPDVVFAGAFSVADTPGWYQESDIVCAPSPYGESFGIVVAEAMASGKPVVAAANAGYRTLLTGEGAEFLTSPGDADALYEKLRQLVLDAGLRARLGDWGRREAMRYDCRALAPRLLAIYEEAIMKSKSRLKPAGRFVGDRRGA